MGELVWETPIVEGGREREVEIHRGREREMKR